MYIEKHGKKFRVRISEYGSLVKKTFATLEEATAFQEAYQRRERWNRKPTIVERDKHHITLTPAPYALAFLSDLHFGNAMTDYAQAMRDAEIIRDTHGMYAVFHGDGIDNWILPKMAGLQRGQAMPYDDEMQMFKEWLEVLGDKLLVVVAGNHDNWTYTLAGIDFLRHLVRPTVIYDQHQVVFDISAGASRLRYAVRHKWRGNSILNPTHGLERAARDIDADVYVGGHTHIATLARYFTVRQRDRLAILTGTYKRHDHYGHALGLPPSEHSGCGVLVVDPSKDHVFVRDVAEGADYLTFKLRA